MYICKDCELVFNSPKQYCEDCTPYGGLAESGFSHIYTGCPSCGGAYDEVAKCERCGEDISSESPDKYCIGCINDFITVHNEAIRNLFNEDEYNAILNHLDMVEPFKEEK